VLKAEGEMKKGGRRRAEGGINNYELRIRPPLAPPKEGDQKNRKAKGEMKKNGMNYEFGIV